MLVGFCLLLINKMLVKIFFSLGLALRSSILSLMTEKIYGVIGLWVETNARISSLLFVFLVLRSSESGIAEALIIPFSIRWLEKPRFKRLTINWCRFSTLSSSSSIIVHVFLVKC